MAAVIAAAVGSFGASAARANVVTVLDDTAADFSAGTTDGTQLRMLEGADGAVQLRRTLDAQLDELPATWTSTPWATGGEAKVDNGSLFVDGTLVDTGVAGGPGSSLEFSAVLGAEANRHVGFAVGFSNAPWAIFSTGPDGGGNVYARIFDAGGPAPVPIPGIDATQRHTYRIDWTAAEFVYSVDGTEVARHASTATPMFVQASDLNLSGSGISIDHLVLQTSSQGTFISRPLSANDPRVAAMSIVPSSSTPTGTDIAYATRTADTEGGLAQATWQALGPGGTVQSPKQYVQYRATLSTTQPATTPRLDKVEVRFIIDDQAPLVTIDDFAPSGSSATIKFNVDDASAKVECKLDGAAFADCTSPAEAGSLADGPHAIVVRATDTYGNSASATKTFVVDATAPEVTISDVAVSGGTANVTFSSGEAAGFDCKLDGAAFQRCTSPATFNGLAAGPHTIEVRATDAHGNAGTATRAFVVTPAGGATTPSPGDGTSPDETAPRVGVTPRSVRVSRSGYAKVRATCPATEVSCNVTLALKLNGKRIARKTTTIAGGTKRTLRLRLSNAARTGLAARSRLKVTAVVAASDAAGNRKTKHFRITLRAPSV